MQGDHVALLSAFAEMGLKLRLDMPEQAMEIATVFFRSSTPANEAHVRKYALVFFTYPLLLILNWFTLFPQENMKALAEQRSKNIKALQEKMNLNQKEVKRFNPVILKIILNVCSHSTCNFVLN